MNNISKICCGSSDTDVQEPSRLVKHPNQLVPQRTFGQDLQDSKFYMMRAKKHENGYLISEGHFLPNGNLYDIFISFDGEERRKMIVAIDNKIVSKLDIKDKLKGTTELYLNDRQYLNDELVIVFKWDLSRRGRNMRFKFLTKPISTKITTDSTSSYNTDSSSYNNGDNGRFDLDDEEFEGERYACRLYVYAAE